MTEPSVEGAKYQADRARSETDRTRSDLQDRMDAALDRSRQMMLRRPWLTLGAAVGIGLLVGYALVPKRPEPRPWEMDVEDLRHRLGLDADRSASLTLTTLALPLVNRLAHYGVDYLFNRWQRRRQEATRRRRAQRM